MCVLVHARCMYAIQVLFYNFISDVQKPTFSSFMRPSSCTMRSLRLSCRAAILASSSSRRCLSTRSSASRVGLRVVAASRLLFICCSCSTLSLWISFRMSLEQGGCLLLSNGHQKTWLHVHVSCVQVINFISAILCI